jgi:hypothetical protein
MKKAPSQIARALRALKNAHRLGLLRGVFVLPGPHACKAAIEQFSAVYPGDKLPDLPLAKCDRERCECRYHPIGTDKLRVLDLNGEPPSKSRH